MRIRQEMWLFFIIFILFLVAGTKNAYAIGESCCLSPYHYDVPKNKCVHDSGSMMFADRDILCASGLICNASNTCVINTNTPPPAPPAASGCCNTSGAFFIGNYRASDGKPMCTFNGYLVDDYACHYQKDANEERCDQSNQKCVKLSNLPPSSSGKGGLNEPCFVDPYGKKSCNFGLTCDPSSNTCVDGDPSDVSVSAKTCPDGKSIETALGCVPYEPLPLIEWILKWGIGIGGGIAFLLMAFASFQLMTSSGDPERVKGGQEMFVSAGAGLLFIIFSVFLLQLIGADILQIPGFGN